MSEFGQARGDASELLVANGGWSVRTVSQVKYVGCEDCTGRLASKVRRTARLAKPRRARYSILADMDR